MVAQAVQKQQHDKRMQNWVAEVRNVACEIEEAIVTCLFKVNSSAYSIKKVFHLHKLQIEIDSINSKLKSIGESRQRYQIEFSKGEGSGSSSLRNSRRSYPDEEDGEDHVSMKDTSLALKSRLMK